LAGKHSSLFWSPLATGKKDFTSPKSHFSFSWLINFVRLKKSFRESERRFEAFMVTKIFFPQHKIYHYAKAQTSAKQKDRVFEQISANIIIDKTNYPFNQTIDSH
jgi:hypothetical protein